MSNATRLVQRPRAAGTSTQGIDEPHPPGESVPPPFYMPAAMSLERFRQWTRSIEFPRTGLIAYLGKEIFIDMSPERLRSHGAVKTAVGGTIIPLVLDAKLGKLFLDRTRVVNVTAGVSNEPDGVFVSWNTIRSGKVVLVPTKDGKDYIELEGSPDWVMEVVSPGSVTKDHKKLRAMYHSAGIGEYWLIDARAAAMEFQILVRGQRDYVRSRRSGSWQESPVFGKRFRLRQIRDELGDIDYRLDMK